MKIITFDDIKKMNFSPEQSFEWVSEMIAGKSEAYLPPKIHMSLSGNRFCNVMPSIIMYPDGCIGGVKIVTRYPERIPALDSKILIFNADTGTVLALMDGNWITAMRTGAVAVHSVVNFAKNDYSTIGVIGLGNTARAFLLILSAIENNKNLKIRLLKYKDQAELYIRRFQGYNNLEFEIIDSVENLVSGADVIVSCATYFENDICKDDRFGEGILVVPVHTRGFTNCDLFFDKVFADDTGHVDHFKNFDRFRYYAEVSDVVNGKALGRENSKERILVYNIGVSTHDINFAANIYKMFEKESEKFLRLTDINMQEPIEKFWV